MRQGFLIGAIILWVAINILGGIAELQSNPLDTTDSKTGLTQQETLEGLRKPEITDANPVTIVSKVWNFLKMLGSVLTLWHPTLWQGSAMYMYFLFILPIGISFWVVLVTILRGVGSG